MGRRREMLRRAWDTFWFRMRLGFQVQDEHDRQMRAEWDEFWREWKGP